MANGEKLLEMRGICKAFPGVVALDNVDFELESGEVHVLIGENGAGKSTLMKILSGSYVCDKGEILLGGQRVEFHTPIDALRNGVAMIYQELSPVPHMTVAENIFLGKELKLTRFGLTDTKRMREETAELLRQFDMEYLNPNTLMTHLSVAETQMVEIIKAYSFRTNILIMDEPTSAISEHEVDKLFQIIGMLKSQGVGIVYISHKMDEIQRCADRVTVFRDGRHVGTKKIDEIDIPGIIRMMIGRDITQQFPKEDVEIGGNVLEVEDLADENGKFSGVSFSVRKGEILGIAGLMGSGRTEIVETVFGIRKRKSGTIKVRGESRSIRSPENAMLSGIALVGEDRKGMGLNLKGSVKENITLCTLKKFSRLGVMNRKKETAGVDEQIDLMRIKTPSREQIAVFLSGGNQQKIVISKWLLTEPDVFIMDEPTRGIDVGAKSEIYQIISELAKQGKGIVMVSSELPEILGMSDRVLVMHEGKMTGCLSREEMSQETIMRYATGQHGGNES